MSIGDRPPEPEISGNYYCAYADVIERVADVSELLAEVALDTSFTEEERLRYAAGVVGLLAEVNGSEYPLTSVWFDRAADIDPKKNFPGFMAWDGETESETMQNIRDTRRVLLERGDDLYFILRDFMFTSHVVFHPDSSLGSTIEEQAAELRGRVANAINEREEVPISEDYLRIIKDALIKRPHELRYTSDSIRIEFDELKASRYEFTPEFAAAKQAELDKQAQSIHHQLTKVWRDMFKRGVETNPKWRDVYTGLLSAHTEIDDQVRMLVDDAIRLIIGYDHYRNMPRKPITFGPYNYQELVGGCIVDEKRLLASAQETFERAQQIESTSIGVEMLRDLRPRLRDAATYILRNVNAVHQIMCDAGLAKPYDKNSFYSFWKEVLGASPPRGSGMERGAGGNSEDNVGQHPFAGISQTIGQIASAETFED